jgi:o-succinylbenzoate synthase
VDHAIALFSEGYNTFKIKVGRESIQKEVEILQQLRSALGPDNIIRLDANRSWTISEALQFANALKNIHIEYIEEPTHQIEQLKHFYQESGLPVALDETLNETSPEDLTLFDGIKVLVIKPTNMGGITKFFEWVRYAKKHQLSIVLSSAFESGFTLSILAELAALMNPGERAMGLQTFEWLMQDLVDPRFEAVKGRVNIMEIPATSRIINEEQLQLIKKIQLN